MFSSTQAVRTGAEIQLPARRHNAMSPVGGGTIIVRLLVGILTALHESRRRQAARVIRQYRPELDSIR
jgi:hypothetical protein